MAEKKEPVVKKQQEPVVVTEEKQEVIVSEPIAKEKEEDFTFYVNFSRRDSPMRAILSFAQHRNKDVVKVNKLVLEKQEKIGRLSSANLTEFLKEVAKI